MGSFVSWVTVQLTGWFDYLDYFGQMNAKE